MSHDIGTYILVHNMDQLGMSDNENDNTAHYHDNYAYHVATYVV